MNTEPAQTEIIPSTPPPKSELLVVVEQTGLEPETCQTLLGAFSPFAESVVEWKSKIAAICVPGREPTKVDMDLAHTSRLALVKIRTGADKKRKALKEDVNRRAKAIDGVYNFIEFAISPLEAQCADIEKHFERKQQEIKEALKVQRNELLAPFGIDTSVYLLGEMSDDSFSSLLAGTKAAHEAKIEAARKTEQERIETDTRRLAEEARILAENERLKKEADERAEADRLAKETADREAKEAAAKRAVLKAEREAIEVKALADKQASDKAAKEAEDKLAAERAESAARELAARQEERARADKADADAKAAREAQEKAEADLKAQRDAEAARVAKIEADKKAAALAPDADKIRTLAIAVRTLEAPDLTTAEGKIVASKINEQIAKFAAWLDAEADKISPSEAPLF